MSKKILIILIILVVLLAFAFAWWTISPLFITKEVNDKLDPELEALLEQIDQEAAEVAAPEDPTPAPDTNYQAAEVAAPEDPTPAPDTNYQAAEVAAPEDPTPAPDTNYQAAAEVNILNPEVETPPTTDGTEIGRNEPGQDGAPSQILPEVPESGIRDSQNKEPVLPEPTQKIVTELAVPPRTEAISIPEEPTPSRPVPTVSAKLPITGTGGHSATGDIRVIRTPEETMVRYENYNGTNGPDLRVYLATDLEATDFVDLGKAKGNMGNINYSVPNKVNVSDYNYVLTWCRAFGVLFDYAQLDS